MQLNRTLFASLYIINDSRISYYDVKTGLIELVGLYWLKQIVYTQMCGKVHVRLGFDVFGVLWRLKTHLIKHLNSIIFKKKRF